MALAKTEKDILQEAIAVYGVEAQVLKASEELAELIQALMKWCGNPDKAESVAEEIADVRIMLDQLEDILCESHGFMPDNFLEYRRLKIARLQRRIAARVKIEHGERIDG